MRKISFLFTAIFCIFMLCACDFVVKNIVVNSNGNGGGDGGNNDGNEQINWNAGEITIRTQEHLRELSTRVMDGRNFNGQTIILANDIDLAGSNWSPIFNTLTPFQGTFNGNGNVIRGLATPLFHNTNGTIKKLGVVVNIAGNDVGGLATQNNGVIENCYALGYISGGGVVGGLVGINLGKIENSYSAVEVNNGIAQNRVGGLVGSNNGGTIENSYALAGAASNLVGLNNGAIIGNTALKSESEMRTQNTFVNWDFVNIWSITPSVNNGFPHL